MPAVEIAAALARMAHGDMPLLLEPPPRKPAYDKPAYDKPAEHAIPRRPDPAAHRLRRIPTQVGTQ